MTDEWWLRHPSKKADEGMDELFEDVNEGVDDAYHANSSAVYTLEHVQDETPEDITPEYSPDGWGEPALTVPTKDVANLVLVVPLSAAEAAGRVPRKRRRDADHGAGRRGRLNGGVFTSDPATTRPTSTTRKPPVGVI